MNIDLYGRHAPPLFVAPLIDPACPLVCNAGAGHRASRQDGAPMMHAWSIKDAVAGAFTSSAGARVREPDKAPVPKPVGTLPVAHAVAEAGHTVPRAAARQVHRDVTAGTTFRGRSVQAWPKPAVASAASASGMAGLRQPVSVTVTVDHVFVQSRSDRSQQQLIVCLQHGRIPLTQIASHPRNHP